MCVCVDLFGEVHTCGLRGEGRRDWVKVWSKDESDDYIGTDLIIFFGHILYSQLKLL